MLTKGDKQAKEDLETLIVKNEILIELAGEVLEEISDTRTLIMDEYERIHIENLGKNGEKIERANEECAKIYEKNRLVFQEEGEKMHKSILKQLETMIDGRKELMVLNGKEKEAREITDSIFEVVRNWTNIDFMFSQLLGMREALRTVRSSNANEHQVALIDKIRSRMMSRVRVIQAFHDCNKKMLDIILMSIEEFLDFVELGMDNSNRTKIVVILNSIKNVPFWSLKSEELIDEAIHNIQGTILEIRDQLFQLPLCQLRPRKSIRQTLWDAMDTASAMRNGHILHNDLEFIFEIRSEFEKIYKLNFPSNPKSKTFESSIFSNPEML